MKFRLPSLRRRRIDISHIPDDVLCDIFYLVVEEDPGYGPDAEKRRWSGNMSPIAISHVCSSWRKLALESSFLWTFIYVSRRTKPVMLAGFLARSGTAPLTVRFRFSSEVHEDYLLPNAHTLASHVDRIVAFELIAPYERVLVDVLACFTSPATNLQTIFLCGHSSFTFDTYPFAATLPSLRSVRFQGMDMMPWVQYTNLTSLSISYDHMFPLKNLVWTLQHSPDLEDLKLFFRAPTVDFMLYNSENDLSSDNDFRVSSTIALPCLSNLSVTWSSRRSGVFYMLDCLSFPSTAKVDLSFNGQHESPLHLLQHSNTWSGVAAQFTTMRLILDRQLHLFVLLRSEDHASAVEWTLDAQSVDEALAVLNDAGFGLLSLPSLHSVRVDGRGTLTPLDDGQWLSLLRQISPTAVANVFLKGNDAAVGAFLSVLRSGRDPDSQTGSVLCPRLECVTLSANSWQDLPAVVENVLSTFRSRAMLDARLTTLHIWRTKHPRAPRPARNLISQLKNVVGTVTFDLVEENTSPSYCD